MRRAVAVLGVGALALLSIYTLWRPRAGGPLLLAGGTAFLLWNAAEAYRGWRRSRWPRAAAEIVSYRAQEDAGGLLRRRPHGFLAVLRYRYRVGDRPFEDRTGKGGFRTGADAEAYARAQIGTSLDVFYDPGDPRTTVLAPEIGVLAPVGAVAGFAFAAFGAVSSGVFERSEAEEAAPREVPAPYAGPARRAGDSLLLSLRGGGERALVARGGAPGGGVGYDYHSHLTKLGLHVVTRRSSAPARAATFELVSDRSGKTVAVLDREPAVSPDGLRVFGYSAAEGLQVWRAAGDSLVRELRVGRDRWVPRDVSWRDDSTLRVETAGAPLEVRRRDGRWAADSARRR